MAHNKDLTSARSWVGFYYFCIFGWTRGISSDFNFVIFPARPGSIRRAGQISMKPGPRVNLCRSLSLGKVDCPSTHQLACRRGRFSLIWFNLMYLNSNQAFQRQKNSDYLISGQFEDRNWVVENRIGENIKKLLIDSVFLTTCLRWHKMNTVFTHVRHLYTVSCHLILGDTISLSQ